MIEQDEKTNRDACIKKGLVAKTCQSFLDSNGIAYAIPDEKTTLWSGGFGDRCGWKLLKDLRGTGDAFLQLSANAEWSLQPHPRDHRVYYLVHEDKRFVLFFVKITSHDFATYHSVLSKPEQIEAPEKDVNEDDDVEEEKNNIQN